MARLTVACIALLALLLLLTDPAVGSDYLGLYNQSDEQIHVYVKMARASKWATLTTIPPGERRTIRVSPGAVDVALQWKHTDGRTREYQLSGYDFRNDGRLRNFAEPSYHNFKLVRLLVPTSEGWGQIKWGDENLQPCAWVGASLNGTTYIRVPQKQCEPPIAQTPANPIPPRSEIPDGSQKAAR